MSTQETTSPLRQLAIRLRRLLRVPLRGQWWPQLVSLARYLSRTEVHTYAFSVAANAILSLFPFIVMMFVISRQVFHSRVLTEMVANMVGYFLPSNQSFVIRNMSLLAHPRGQVQVLSIVMLLISSSSVFLPLEVALNEVWGVEKSRPYLWNQLISLGLAMGVGVLAMLSIGMAAAQSQILGFLFMGHTDNVFFNLLAHTFLRVSAALLSVAIFFWTYWVLPNRRVPVRAVLPAAIVTGLIWDVAKAVYVMVLPWLDLRSVYGPFAVSVTLMIWAFLTGLLLLSGAHFSATRYRRLAEQEAEAEPAATGV